MDQYVQTIIGGLYELHSRGAVRSEGDSILQGLRVTADQLAQALADAATAPPAAPAGDDSAALSAVVAELASVRQALAELTAAVMPTVPKE